MSAAPIDEKFLPGIRWAILRTCRVGGYLGATEAMIREVIVAEYLGADRQFIRDQLHYLESRKLIEVERTEIRPWVAKLTRHGYDVADYQVEVAPGISRPPRLDSRGG